MLVSVAGALSRAGKTAAAVSVLGALRGAAAVKFTVTEEVFTRCPRGTPCVVCDIDRPFRIVREPEILREAGTDTDRLAAAGARPVLWAIARAGAAASAWQAVRSLLPAGAPVVMEGSTVVDLARPDHLVFVVHPFLSPARWKPTSAALLARADLVVVNRLGGERRPPDAAVMAAVREHRGRDDARVADVTRPLAEWAPELAAAFRPGEAAGTEWGR
jgi:hypothetical protein